MPINSLFYIFGFCLCFSALCSVLSKKPVHSVLYLVLSFFSAAWVMLALYAEFLAMLLIIVYVGAVAVLFLFVVMMLQTNYTPVKSPLQSFSALTIGLVIFFQIFGVINFVNIQPANITVTNLALQTLAHNLYITHFINFQIVGLILLISMIGAMVLAYSKSSTFTHTQTIARQILRTKEECITITSPAIGKGVTL